MSSPIVGPIAPFNNPPIQPQNYQPSLFFITALSLGATTTVTTSIDHNYVLGQLVRLRIPSFYGSYQLNDQTGYVTSIPAANQVTLNIPSYICDPFIPTPPFGPNRPQISAIGDANTGSINSNGRISTSISVPGSFINISP